METQLCLLIKRNNNFMNNFNKEGKDKRNQGFIEARIQLLDDYWTKF